MLSDRGRLGRWFGALPQPPYHYPWTVAILPFIEGKPNYDAINKRIPIMADQGNPQRFTGQTSNTTPPAYGANGFPRLHSQQIPAFRCPSDHTSSGPGDLPMEMMWSNYAASEGVGYFPAKLVESDEGTRPESSAPNDRKGLFPFADWTAFADVSDGTSMTIAVAEVTAGSVTNQLDANDDEILAQTAPIVSFTGAMPAPPDWLLGEAGKPPGLPLQGGTGRPRASLFTSQQTRAPMVFRSLWVALTSSVTGGAAARAAITISGRSAARAEAPMASSCTRRLAFLRPCTELPRPTTPFTRPTPTGPGPTAAHPGAIIVVFADGHTQTIQQNIDYQVWASLNTRAGKEQIGGEF